jgi:mono/diheme cytochrome c family protein
MRYVLLGSAIALGAFEACYVGPIEQNDLRASTRPTDPSATGATSDAGSAGAGEGLPCDVDALLAQRCRSCHVPGGAGPMPLVSYEDLAAPAKSNAAKTNAVASIERLRSPDRPMPPPPLERAPSAEIVVLERWVASGMPRGECGAKAQDGGSSRIQSVCTSGTFWSGNRRGPTMQPGRACITCHESQEDDPVVWVGGTVYPTLREPDGCYGVDGNATVVITDASGRVVSLPVGPTGNFSLRAESSAPLTMPIRAKVVKNGIERAMATPQSSGNCNGCHTEDGANGAPGRILVP